MLTLTRRERILVESHGKPMPDLLRDALHRGGTRWAAAADLKCTPNTFSAWCDRWGIDADVEIARGVLDKRSA